MAIISTRYYCYDGYYGSDCNSAWYNWGRWVLFGVIVIGAFLIFLGLACISARRRRQRGLQPFRGTGWAAYGAPAPPYQQNPQGYYNQQQYPAPPKYSQNPNGYGYYGNQPNTGGQNQGYFGGQQEGVELQQPPNTYRGGEPVYAPPPGPPPAKS